MKLIGKAKGKAPNAWCMIRNTTNGLYYTDYTGDWPLTGNYAAVKEAVEQANINAQPEPVVGPEVHWPGFHPHCRPSHATPLTQQQKDDYAAYEEYRQKVYAHAQWERAELKRVLEPLDFAPVFEAELRFTGYTRGRSSVTMKFEAENGQVVEFGPAGINILIQSMIDGETANMMLSGTYEVKEDWDSTAQEYKTIKQVPRGKGIKATFKFTKKGQNVYAELVNEWTVL
ncbi:MAG: hypothetical protein RR740_00535 [Pseudomonas sp.]